MKQAKNSTCYSLHRDKNILLYDGECGLCSRSIQFLLNRNPKALYFASLQSDVGLALLSEHGIAEQLDYVVYIRKGERNVPFLRSRALLSALSDLGGLWRITGVLRVLPSFLTDFLYNLVARNRHKLFAKRCMLPTQKTRHLFLDK